MATKRYKRDLKGLEARRWRGMRLRVWRGCRRPLGKPGALNAADKGKLIAREFWPSYSNVHVMRLLREFVFSCQKPENRAIQRDEQAIGEWKAKRCLRSKKAQREGRTIVFIDESGLNDRPTRVRI